MTSQSIQGDAGHGGGSGRHGRLLVFNLATDAEDPILGFTSSWVRALADRVEAVDVLTMRLGRVDLPENVEVFSVGKERGFGELRRGIEFYRVLGRLLRTRSYDGAFAHMIPVFAVMAAPLLRMRRVPLTLWYAHGHASRMLRASTRLVDHAVTSSPEGFPVHTTRLRVIGQGIDTDQFAPSAERLRDDAAPVVVAVGRVAPVKRIELLIESLSVLRARGVRFEARIVGPSQDGSGEYAEVLRGQVAERGLADVVTLVGALPFSAIADEYRRATLAVNLARTGSLDKVVLEAMACGVPVVTANPPYREVLAGFDGLFVRDRAEDVAAAMERILMLESAQRQEMGMRLRALVVRHHSLGRLAGVLLDEVLFASRSGTAL